MILKTVQNSNGQLVIQFEVTCWNDAKKIVGILKNEFRAHVYDTAEGPDARSWFMFINSEEITMYQWDDGAVHILAKFLSGNKIITEISEFLERY